MNTLDPRPAPALRAVSVDGDARPAASAAPQTAAPDLVIDSFEPLGDRPTQGRPLWLELRVKNVGNAAAGPFEVRLSEEAQDSQRLPGLAAGASRALTTGPIYYRNGEQLYTVRADVDPDNEVAESDEDNNYTILFLSGDHPPQPPIPQPPLPPLPLPRPPRP